MPERLSVPPEVQLQVLWVHRMKPPPDTLYVGVGHVAADALVITVRIGTPVRGDHSWSAVVEILGFNWTHRATCQGED